VLMTWKFEVGPEMQFSLQLRAAVMLILQYLRTSNRLMSPSDLNGYESWSLTLRVESRSRVFEQGAEGNVWI
jgi:hypothetical protein